MSRTEILTGYRIILWRVQLYVGWPQRRVDARCYRYRTLVNEEVFAVWEHDGDHRHSQPPPPRTLNQVERDALDRQVSIHFGATAHQLRTGNAGPHSVPLHDIADTLANARSARYHVAQSQARQGLVAPSAMRGGFSTLTSVADIKDKDGNPFLIASSLSDPQYLMFQTSFMRDMLSESILEWEQEDPRADGRHGLVTDGSHSFFREGLLVATCVFITKLAAWVPCLYTWTGGESTEHFRPHFREISQFILKTMGPKFDRKFLLHVMDFSAAQQKAHHEEYVDAVMASLAPLLASLDPSAVAAQRAAISSQGARVGCNMHFLQSVTRIRDTQAIVPPALAPRFMSLITTMMGNETTEAQFDDAVATLSSEFPTIRNWLKWWMQPWVMSMAFPAKSKVLVHVRRQVPSTSNPIEHQHHLLNHATATDQDLVPGIMALLKHVQEREAQYSAILKGVYTPADIKKRVRREEKPYENDGRAPDTIERLKIADSQSPPLAENRLVGYRWNGNSCFVDATLEALYRSVDSNDWSQSDITAAHALFPADSFLASIFHHFARRTKASRMKTTTKIAQELALGQSQTMACLVDRLQLLQHGDMFCAVSWLQPAIRERNTPVNAQALFGIQQRVTRRCEQGHTFTSFDPPLPLPVTNIDLSCVSALRAIYPNATFTPHHYFNHFLPLREGKPVHESPAIKCGDPGCPCMAKVNDKDWIELFWPKVLGCCTKGQATVPSPDSVYQSVLHFSDSFTIDDSTDDGDGNSVSYSLSGVVLYADSHYCSIVYIEGMKYFYDDTDCSSGDNLVRLKPLQPAEAAQKLFTMSPVMYVYTRTSSKATTRRSVTAIKADSQRRSDVLAGIKANVLDFTHLPSTSPQDEKPPARVILSQSKKTVASKVTSQTPSARGARGRSSTRSRARGGRRGRGGGRGGSNGALEQKAQDKVKQESEDGEEDKADPESEEEMEREADNASMVGIGIAVDDRVLEASHTSLVSLPHASLGIIPAFPTSAPLQPPRLCLPMLDCGKSSTADDVKDTVRCALCRRVWHVSCVGDTLPGGFISGIDDCDDWCCDMCLLATDSPWDSRMIGQFILVKHDSDFGQPMYYPALVHARSGSTVRMLWHVGNLYESADMRPNTQAFFMNARECLQAYYQSDEITGNIGGFQSEGMGTIMWPSILNPQAVDELNYQEDGLVEALHQASGVVLAVLAGTVPHHIWGILEYWWNQSETRTVQQQTRALTNFALAFNFPIYPAYENHIYPFLLVVETFARSTSTFSTIHYHAAHTLALILFRAAATRFQLQLGDNNLVFLLAYHGPVGTAASSFTQQEQDAYGGRLTRSPSVHEQAYASSVPGVVDTRAVLSHSALGALKREAWSGATDTNSPVHALTPTGHPFPFRDADESSCTQIEAPRPPLPREFVSESSLSAAVATGTRPQPRRSGKAQKVSPLNVFTTALEQSPLLRIIPSIRPATQNPPPATQVPPPPLSIEQDLPPPSPTEPAPSAQDSAPTPVEPTRGRSLRSQKRKGSPKKQTAKRIKVNGARYAYVDAEGNEVDVDILV